MCYPKPGPRCSAHAADSVFRTTDALAQARESGNRDQIMQAQSAYVTAVNNYHATPQGQRELRSEMEVLISRGALDNNDRRLLQFKGEQLEKGISTRKNQKSALETKKAHDKIISESRSWEEVESRTLELDPRCKNDWNDAKLVVSSRHYYYYPQTLAAVTNQCEKELGSYHAIVRYLKSNHDSANVMDAQEFANDLHHAERTLHALREEQELAEDITRFTEKKHALTHASSLWETFSDSKNWDSGDNLEHAYKRLHAAIKGSYEDAEGGHKEGYGLVLDYLRRTRVNF